MIINKKQLSTTNDKKELIDLAETAVQSVMPDILMKENVDFDGKNRILKISNIKFKLGNGRIFVIGGGKASGKMAKAIEKIIGAGNIESGLVNTLSDNESLKKIKLVKATHPLPGSAGVKGVEKMLELKDKYAINKEDMVLCLISGGGSALMPAPVDDISLQDKIITSEALIKSGARIHEINAVRKHLSKIKGGRLAKHFIPARVVSLIISDVMGDDLDVIASGPTVADKSSFRDAQGAIKKHKLENKIPKKVLNYLNNGIKNKNLETPKRLYRTNNFIIGRNKTALKAINNIANKGNIFENHIQGPPEKAAKNIKSEILKHSNYQYLIFGGESTPKLPANHGKGGRNMHLLACLIKELEVMQKDWSAIAFGTDGVDYMKGYAGAVYDSREKNIDLNMDLNIYLKKFDTFNLFKKTNRNLLKAEGTGTNVCDVLIVKVY